MKKLILLMLSAAMLLTGCSARAQELEESAVVRALAFDRGEKGCSVSAYIAGAEEGSVISAEAGTVAEAFFQLNTRTERRIFLGLQPEIPRLFVCPNIQRPENHRSARHIGQYPAVNGQLFLLGGEIL